MRVSYMPLADGAALLLMQAWGVAQRADRAVLQAHHVVVAAVHGSHDGRPYLDPRDIQVDEDVLAAAAATPEPDVPPQTGPSLMEALRVAQGLAARAQRDEVATQDVVLACWTVASRTHPDLLGVLPNARAVLRMDSGEDGPFDRASLAVVRRLRSIGEAADDVITRKLPWMTRLQQAALGSRAALTSLKDAWERPATYLTFLVLLPGLGVREGLRFLTARLAGSGVVHRSAVASAGEDLEIWPYAGPGWTTTIRLAPSFLTFLVGVLCLVPPTVRSTGAGASLIPALASLPEGTRDGLEPTALLVALLISPSGLTIWAALACFVACPPRSMEVGLLSAQLRAGTGRQRLIGVMLSPFAALAAISSVAERVATMAGLPAIVGPGAVVFFAGVSITRRGVRLALSG